VGRATGSDGNGAARSRRAGGCMARAEPLAVGAARDCLRFKRAGGVGRPAACGPVMELGRDVVHARSEQVVDGMITRHLRCRGNVERLKICHRCIFSW